MDDDESEVRPCRIRHDVEAYRSATATTRAALSVTVTYRRSRLHATVRRATALVSKLRSRPYCRILNLANMIAAAAWMLSFVVLTRT